MKNRHKYKSDAFEAVHSTVAGMYKAGTVDKETMRSIDLAESQQRSEGRQHGNHQQQNG